MFKSPIYTVFIGFVLLAVLAWVTHRPEDDSVHEITSAPDQPSTFQSVCANCHGINGEGKRELMTPSIASLPRWYLEEQIRKFRNGQRGAHPDDIHGQQMRAAISALSEGQITEALDHIESLPAQSHASTLGGDSVRGLEIYREHCMACHRFNGHGELAFHSASLNGLQDWYLLEQINKFQQGIRGYHPDDEGGSKMRQAVANISSEQQKLDIMALLTELAETYPVTKGDKKQAQNKRLPGP